jgi:hypothetical protein
MNGQIKESNMVGARSNQQHAKSNFVERRGKSRFPDLYPMVVRGVDAGGREFNAYTVLENLSSSGLYAQMLVKLNEGTKLSVEIRPPLDRAMARIEGRCIVVRIEPKAHGLWGVALKFISHRLIY